MMVQHPYDPDVPPAGNTPAGHGAEHAPSTSGAGHAASQSGAEHAASRRGDKHAVSRSGGEHAASRSGPEHAASRSEPGSRGRGGSAGPGARSLDDLFPSNGVRPRIVIKPGLVVPPAEASPPEPEDLPAAMDPVVDTLAGRTTAVLTGAGLSTDSGIPDYRSPGSPPRRPMTFQQFVSSAEHRAHYWARNHLGWRNLHHAQPNPGHRALAAMEASGAINGIITQNIDMLHDRAGSERVVHLHGRYDQVVCLDCGAVTPRTRLDERLEALNPGWREQVIDDLEVAPDADVVLDQTADFQVAPCERCGGALIPDVVFFGANTPRERVVDAQRLVDEADALLVAGSSLAVMGGLRFARRAAKARKPVVIINRGPTRGDDLAAVKVQASTSRALPYLAEHLDGR